MKSNTDWNTPNVAATNESNFSALPGGTFWCDEVFFGFVGLGSSGWWWSSSDTAFFWSRQRRIDNYSGYIINSAGEWPYACSIRCLRDQPASGRLEETSTIQGINIYPNPTNNNINVVIQATSETQTNIRITDLLGRVVLEQTEALIAGSNTITYNISDFAKGVYLIQVSNGNEQKVFKLVKE